MKTTSKLIFLSSVIALLFAPPTFAQEVESSGASESTEPVAAAESPESSQEAAAESPDVAADGAAKETVSEVQAGDDEPVSETKEDAGTDDSKPAIARREHESRDPRLGSSQTSGHASKAT